MHILVETYDVVVGFRLMIRDSTLQIIRAAGAHQLTGTMNAVVTETN
jgi:hypothetical protein